jgi:Tfp pilus assembly protein PilX
MNTMPKLSIRARLGATILLLSMLLIVIGALGVTGMARSNDANRETYENRLASTRLIGDAELSISRQHRPSIKTWPRTACSKGKAWRPGSNTSLCPPH